MNRMRFLEKKYVIMGVATGLTRVWAPEAHRKRATKSNTKYSSPRWNLSYSVAAIGLLLFIAVYEDLLLYKSYTLGIFFYSFFEDAFSRISYKQMVKFCTVKNVKFYVIRYNVKFYVFYCTKFYHLQKDSIKTYLV